jgi:hypothetical protein
MTHTISLASCLAFAVVLLPAGSALGAEWYVDQSAAAGGDGSSAHPFRAINDVMDGLRTGDTVWVRDGVYHETLNFYHLQGAYDEAHRTTVAAAQGSSSVVIDGDGTGNEFIVQAATPYMTFRGLTVRNGSGEAFQFYGCRPGSCGSGEAAADWGEVIDCKTEAVQTGLVFYFTGHGRVVNSDLYGGVAGKGSDGTQILGSRVHHSQVEGLALHDNSKNCKYLNNLVYDNPRPNIYLDSASSMTVDGNVIFMSADPPVDNAGIQLADETYAELTAPVTANITITNNVIFNTYDGIYFWDSGSWNGQSGMKNVTIANNTIINSKNRGMFWDPGAHHDTFIRNNIVATAPGVGSLAIRAKATAGFTLDHNLWYMPGVAQPFDWGGSVTDHSAWVSASGQGSGDVVGDPLFVASTWSLPASNFMLNAGSPAVDKGVADVPIPTGDHTLDHDFALASRPAGQAIDIGAFEYGATPADPDAGNPALDSGASGGSGGAGGGGSGAASGAGASGGSGASGHGGNSAGDSGTQPGADSGASDAAASPAEGPGEDSGCGCRTALSQRYGAGAVLLLGLAALTRRRRMRNRR